MRRREQRNPTLARRHACNCPSSSGNLPDVRKIGASRFEFTQVLDQTGKDGLIEVRALQAFRINEYHVPGTGTFRGDGGSSVLFVESVFEFWIDCVAGYERIRPKTV